MTGAAAVSSSSASASPVNTVCVTTLLCPASQAVTGECGDYKCSLLPLRCGGCDLTGPCTHVDGRVGSQGTHDASATARNEATSHPAPCDPLLDDVETDLPPHHYSETEAEQQSRAHHTDDFAGVSEPRFLAALMDRVESAESEMTHKMERHFQQTRQQLDAIREEMASKLREAMAECEASSGGVEERCGTALRTLMAELEHRQRVAPEIDVRVQLAKLIQEGMLCVKDQIGSWRRHASAEAGANEATAERERHGSNERRPDLNARLFLHETSARLKELGW